MVIGFIVHYLVWYLPLFLLKARYLNLGINYLKVCFSLVYVFCTIIMLELLTKWPLVMNRDRKKLVWQSVFDLLIFNFHSSGAVWFFALDAWRYSCSVNRWYKFRSFFQDDTEAKILCSHKLEYICKYIKFDVGHVNFSLIW